jgi:signal transduction histidine kinase
VLFKNFPIRRKLRAVILLTSGTALLLTCLAFIGYELFTFRRGALDNLETLGEIMAENNTAAMAFHNEEDARKMLSSLRAEPTIVIAALYDNEGKLFARFPEKVPAKAVPSASQPDGHRFAGSHLILFQPVQEGTKRYGTLVLESDLRDMYQRLRRYGEIALLVLAGSLTIAFLLSDFLQKSISHPIMSLAATARIVSEKSDYSVRAKKESDDELGLLTDAFNQMLTEIHRNQVRLNEALAETRSSEQKVKELNLELEHRVEERTAELQEAVSQMETFSYSVSHDLRAPLRAMEGYSQALIEDYGPQMDETARDYLSRIQSSSTRMDRLIQDILAYSRVARAELTIENVNVDKLVTDLVQQNPNLQEPRATVIIEKPLAAVRAYEPALGQCLANLLNNAVKFVAKETKPAVSVRTQSVNGHVRITVQDNGIGINPEYLDRIFGMFERINTKAYEGTGIGLAIVKKAVERMGGKVGVESQEGKGSCFWIQLPKA